MKRKFAFGAVAGLCCAALAAWGASWFAAYTEGKMQEQECAMLYEQVRNAAIGCYAIEGRYPMTLDHLVEHYGLIYDENQYSILYDAFASNIMPDIAVSIRGEDER